MRLSPGTRLGPYEIVTPIGAGGMGEVYRARDTRLDRDVAIKVLPSAVASDPDRLARFEREAKVLASINHPHIATVFGFVESPAGTGLIMEFVDGETLKSPLPIAEALRVAIQIVTALGAAHERGITHRDLKPANIMVTRTGIKLLDFGLAKSRAGDGQLSLTQTEAGAIVGTACYMSPEQAQGRAVDVRSDIFSFGAVLYEMISGVRAFPSDSLASTLVSVLRDEPAPIHAPVELQSIVNRCLRKVAADRFQCATDLKAALEEAAVSAGASEPAGVVRSFWIAVAPLKYTGSELAALAEGITDEIVAGLSRFSYLRVLTQESSAGARYLIEGSLRQAGSQLRATIQLADIATGARLWAETYNRSYSPDAIFETQDSLVAPIVASVAEWGGVLVHSMLMALRERDPRTLTPYEALLRGSGWSELLSPEETRLALEVLTLATEQEPNHSGCLAMLAMVHGHGYLFSFWDNPKSRDLCLSYARRAVAADANDHLAFYALGLAHSCFKNIPAFRNAAERALALNPLDGSITAHVGMWTAYNGDWERGCGLVRRAMSLNPRHKGWYWFPLAHDAYRRHDYAAALEYALRVNLPGLFWTHELLARAHAQMGNQAAAAHALEELLALRPDFRVNARQELEKWFLESSVVEDMLEGLRKAGLELDTDAPEMASAPKPASAVTPAPSIAVLPFANLSADKEQEYFGDGLAEEILNALTQVPGLRVIARASAFAFRGRENSIAEIGERLKVTHVLHGSVRRADSRIRVTAQLIRVSDETQVWAERYDRELRDVFDIQDEIAQAIVAQLKIKFGAKADTPLVKRYTENLEAHNLYLRGTFHVHRLTNSEIQRGREFLERAVALDPHYAPALFELAGYYVAMGHRGALPIEQWAKVRALAKRAIEADPAFADAHAVLGFMEAVCDFQWKDALRQLDGALELNPACAIAHFWRSNVLFYSGLVDEALAAVERAVQLDPLLALLHTYRAIYSLLLDRPEQALEYARRSLEVDENFPAGTQVMGEALSLLGNHQDGAALIERTCSGLPPGYFYSALLAWVYVRSGRTQDAESLRVSLIETSERQYIPAATHAFLAAALGDRESALTFAETAVQERDPNLPLWIRSQYFRSLHSDPRFDQLLARMNLGR